MSTRKTFNEYVVRIYGGNEGRVGLLMCYNDGLFVGRIDFYPDSTDLVQDYLWHSAVNEYIILKMPISRLDTVLSTVRNEKPLQLYINVNRGTGSSTSGTGYLVTTEKEPVGEEEGTL